MARGKQFPQRSKRTSKRKQVDLEIETRTTRQLVRNEPDVRKKFSKHDMKIISPLTENQKNAFNEWYNEENTVIAMMGAAGTGKTMLACHFALNSVLDPDSPYEKVIICRSSVSSRDIGHLPGEVELKLAPYMEIYGDIFDFLFPFKKSFHNMKEIGLVEFECTSFLRGKTFDNAIIIFDEVVNATYVECETVLTRLGLNSRMILCGDISQNDLGSKSGFREIEKFLRKTPNTKFIEFTIDDIVRSNWVKSYLTSKYSK